MIARWFWREWRSPSLLIVWLALSLAVACVLALGNISDRMEKGLSQQSREFMAGDRALRSSREVPQAWLEEAQKRGLKVGKQLTFATMTFAGDTPQLANVKAVDDIYPMYGDLQTNLPGLKPQAGSVLLAPRLMALLNLGTGRRRAGAIDGTLATVPAAFGASDLAAGSGSGGGSDESLLSQSLRSGGDPQNAGGRASATA